MSEHSYKSQIVVIDCSIYHQNITEKMAASQSVWNWMSAIRKLRPHYYIYIYNNVYTYKILYDNVYVYTNNYW